MADLLGDVTDDERVNILDSHAVARWAVGLDIPSNISSRVTTYGDVTSSGTVDVGDSQQIARWAHGFEVAFPIGEDL